MNFIIFSTQRSGTHMLQSALNNHSQISCVGEVKINWKKNMDKLDETKITGCIVQLSQREDIRKLKPNKIIYLKRNPQDIAKSQIGMKKSKELGKKGIIKHDMIRPKTPLTFYINKKQFNKRVEIVKYQQKRIIEEIEKSKLPYIIVDYENIDYNKIFNFLEVNKENIKPETKKAPFKYILTDKETQVK